VRCALVPLCVTLLLCAPAKAATIGGPFTLTNGAGQTVTAQSLRGKFLLIFFGYTACPDECPTTLAKIARALAAPSLATANVAALFITIDPSRDSPALAGKYAALFSPRLTGLSGTQAQIRQIIAEYHVYAAPTDPATGAISHSALIYLISPTDAFLTAFPPDLTDAALTAQIAKTIKTPGA
jgi:protein SCO1/2